MQSKFVLTVLKPRKPAVELKFDNYFDFRSHKSKYTREGYSVAAYVEINKEGEIDYEDEEGFVNL